MKDTACSILPGRVCIRCGRPASMTDGAGNSICRSHYRLQYQRRPVPEDWGICFDGGIDPRKSENRK